MTPRRFIVIIEGNYHEMRAFGVFRSFKAAERAAKAAKTVGRAYVLPLEAIGDIP